MGGAGRLGASVIRSRRGSAVRPASSALPLIPDADEARRWAERELADPVYRAAEPTPFDRLARSVGDFVASLFSGDVPGALTPWLAVVVVAVLLAVVALALVIWGRPRRVVRARAPMALFGASDALTAPQLRDRADGAARRGEWSEAVAVRFRALAAALVERTLIDPAPGATVHAFARQAAQVFPGERDALERGADLFDDVRYLRRTGTEEAYRWVSDLDDRLAATSPALDPAVASGWGASA
jgi:hypothetical protein